MPDFLTPGALRPGDTVAVVSLSSGFAADVPHRYAAGKQQLETALGVRVIDAPNALRGSDFLYRNPQARADDLHWALANPAVRGVVSAIGGDDSVRLLPHLDLDLIRAHPKVFMGFSDTTVTLTQFLRAGVVAFHGPAVLTDLAENAGMHPFVRDAIRPALQQGAPFSLREAPEWTEAFLDWRDPALQRQPRTFQPSGGWVWLQGETRAQGHLMGGCLEVLDMLNGTPGWPGAALWEGAILCLETSEEVPAPSQVGYWLRNYGAQGVLGRAAGLLLARPRGYTPAMKAELFAWVRRVLWEYGREDLPVVADVDFGHTSPQLVLPLGVRAEIDPAARVVRVLDAPTA